MKFLIADNNLVMLNFLNDLLHKEGFEVIKADSGKAAIEQYNKHKPDFICLDVMMPDLSGFDVCKEIRLYDEETPVIFITSKDQVDDKISGLEIGADDYIIKPFDTKEVVARIRAIIRRSVVQRDKGSAAKEKKMQSFKMAELEVTPAKLCAARDEDMIDLSLRDVKILQLLHDNKNTVVHRDVLIDFCWGAHIMPESRTVDWHMSQLRKKIEIDPKDPVIIKTVHGVGYRYEER